MQDVWIKSLYTGHKRICDSNAGKQICEKLLQDTGQVFRRDREREKERKRGSLLPMLLWGTDVTPVPHLHRDRFIHLFPVRKFGEINLDLKNNWVAFSQGDMYIKNTNVQKRTFAFVLI